jgi:L-ornithine N5-oxygenase
MRSPGLKTCQNSKSTNELHLPGFADTFFSAQPSAREQIFRDLPTTSYSTPSAPILDKIYRDLYLDRLTGRGAMRMVTMTDVTAVREEKGEVVLMTTERKTGRAEELRCDLVLLGTGYVREMPAVIQGLAQALGLDRIEITRNCRLETKSGAASCYLQGVNGATHGTADSLLSVLAVRAADITRDILAGRPRTRRSPAASDTT